MKQALMVAHDYPPSNVVGAVRPSKFVHYLPGFGWEPIVLACRDGHQDIPGNSTAEIYHVREWPHPLKTYLRFMEERAKKRGRSEEFADQMIASNVTISSPRVAGLKRGLLNFLNLPDQELGW